MRGAERASAAPGASAVASWRPIRPKGLKEHNRDPAAVGASTPEINATVIETGSTGASSAAASAAWLGPADATLATMVAVGGQIAASLAGAPA